MKFWNTAASAFIALVGLTASASADYIPFNVDITMPGATATGFFSAFQNSNNNSLVGGPFNFNLTEGAFSATLNGSALGNNAQVAVGDPSGNTISVTDDQVFFDFSSTNLDFLKFYTGAGDILCFQTASASNESFCGGGGVGAGIVILVAGAPDPFLPMTGNQVIASSAAAVPGPTVGAGASSFALAALFLGWLVRRRGHQMV